MPRRADQFRQSDVTLWGTVALVAVGLAIVGANVSAAVPDTVFAGLHATRFIDRSAADLRAQLSEVSDARTELAGLTAAEQQLQAANERLASRFDGLVEEAGGVRERVGALEEAVPRLVKALPAVGTVDPTVITGSIGGQPGPGAVAAVAAPTAPSASAAAAAGSQPMPRPLAPLVRDPTGDGVTATTGMSGGAATAAASSRATADTSAQPVRAAPEIPAGAASPQPAGATASRSTSDPWSATPARNALATAASGAEAGTPAADATTMAALSRKAGPVPLAPFRDPADSPAASGAGQPDAIAPSAQPAASMTQPGAITASTAAAPAATPDVRAIGVAIGPPVTPGAALAAWEGLASKVGVMLVGMSPLLADDPGGSGGKVLVAGPIGSITIATTLCADIDRAGLACTPMPYVGAELGAGTASPAASGAALPE